MSRQAAPATSPCPSEEELLDPASAGGHDEHVDRCAACRLALAAVATGRATEETMGRYRVDAVIGHGAMGIVLRGHDPALDRPIALKVVRASRDEPDFRDRLRREARALARLNHPNVCQVYDVGEEGGETFVAMELVDGVSLRAHLAQSSPPSRERAALLAAAGRGLAAAHAAGVVHRDVKPDNVLVVRARASEPARVVVTDFGLADPGSGQAPAESDLGEGGGDAEARPARTRAVGTLGYAPPEQLLGRPVDARADQFAFCVMAWEAFAGRLPFEGRTVAELALAIGRGAAPCPGAPPAIARALARGLAADPAHRFPSMNALLEAFAPRRTARVVVAAIAAPLALGLGAWLVASRGSAPPVATTTAAREPPADPRSAPRPAPSPAQATSAPASAPSEPPASAPAASALLPARPPDATPPRPPTADARSDPRPTPAPPGAKAVTADALDGEVATWCTLVVDPARPPADAPAWHRADWGRVSRVDHARVALGGFPATDADLIEVRGTAGVRRFARWARDGFAAGDQVIFCDNGPAPDTVREQVPAAFRDGLRMVSFAARIGGPPLIVTKAAFDPIHVKAADLAGAQTTGAWRFAPGRAVLARIVVAAREDATHVRVGSGAGAWLLEIPPGTPGADRIAPSTAAWAIVTNARFEPGPPRRLVLTLRDAERAYVR